MAAERSISDEYGAKSAVERERALAELAARQHGVVALRQLLALGFSARAVGRRVASGRLHRLHRGVYAVGHPRITQRGRWTAAVLAGGPEALLSHRSAAHLHDLRSWSPGTVEVVTRRKVRRPGVRFRLASLLGEADRDRVDGVACTSVSCTLLGVAAVDPRSLGSALAAAERRSVLDLRAIEELLSRAPGRPGVRALRDGVAGFAIELGWTRSELERRASVVFAAAGLSRPRVNAWVEVPGDGFEVDFSWPRWCLAVELDGFGSHGDRAAFERDRRRDQALAAAGWRVLRFTWRQLAEEPERVVATLRRLMPAAAPGVGPAGDR